MKLPLQHLQAWLSSTFEDVKKHYLLSLICCLLSSIYLLYYYLSYTTQPEVSLYIFLIELTLIFITIDNARLYPSSPRKHHYLYLLLLAPICILFFPDFSQSIASRIYCISSLFSSSLLFFISPTLYHKGQDKSNYPLLLTHLGHIILSFVIAGILTFSVCILLFSCEDLLRLNIHAKLWQYILWLSLYMLPIFSFCTLSVRPSNTKVAHLGHNKRLTLFQNILFIILLTYILFLLFYSLSFILHRHLPQGRVFFPALYCFAIWCIYTFLSYPTRLQPNKPQNFAWLHKSIPFFVLGTVLLMTLALGQRIANYGCTISRIYGLLFIAWCYYLVIGHYRQQYADFRKMLISLAALSFITALGPWSVSNLTRTYMQHQLQTRLSSIEHLQLPLTAQTFSSTLDQFDFKDKNRILSSLTYLNEKYSEDAIKEFITSDTLLVQHVRDFDIRLAVDESTPILLPPNAVAILYKNKWTHEAKKPTTVVQQTIKDSINFKHEIISFTYDIPLKKLQDKQLTLPLYLSTSQPNIAVILTSYLCFDLTTAYDSQLNATYVITK